MILMPDGRDITSDSSVTVDEVRTALIGEVRAHGSAATDYAEKLFLCLGLLSDNKSAESAELLIPPVPKKLQKYRDYIREKAFLALVRPILEPDRTKTVGDAMRELGWPGWAKN